MSYCQANIKDCEAEEFICEGGGIACSRHGHVDDCEKEKCKSLVSEDFWTEERLRLADRLGKTAKLEKVDNLTWG